LGEELGNNDLFQGKVVGEVKERTKWKRCCNKEHYFTFLLSFTTRRILVIVFWKTRREETTFQIQAYMGG
jgi:hypothetical protein